MKKDPIGAPLLLVHPRVAPPRVGLSRATDLIARANIRIWGLCSEKGRPIDRPKENPATVRCSGLLAGSNAKCEQCNHTHSGNQHCECYRIVIQPMQPLLHGKPPCLSEKAAETTSPAGVGTAVKESVQGKPHHWAKVVAGFPAPVLLGSEISFGATGATLPAETCSGNRFDQIALPS